MSKRSHLNAPLPHQPNPLEMLLTTLAALFLLGWGVTAFSTQDPLWFMPNNVERLPTRIELYDAGALTTLRASDAGFAEIATMLNGQINTMSGYWEHGLGDQAREDAYSKNQTIVFVYDDPLLLHTRWNIGRPNNLLIPITGSYSNENRIYLGTNGRYGSGALVVADLQPLRALAREFGGTP